MSDMQYSRNPQCKDTSGECFGRTSGNRCKVLNHCPSVCPFKKPEKEVTNGKRYPRLNQAGGRVITKEEWLILKGVL